MQESTAAVAKPGAVAADLLLTFTATHVGGGISQWIVGWVPGQGNAVDASTAAALTVDWPSSQERLRAELATWTAEPAGATHRRNQKIERLASELVVELAPRSLVRASDAALIERVRPSLLALRDSIARLLVSERHALSHDPKESAMLLPTTTASFGEPLLVDRRSIGASLRTDRARSRPKGSVGVVAWARVALSGRPPVAGARRRLPSLFATAGAATLRRRACG
ncbi:hypothetical protein [Sorangium sp. So ce426]|uniref:hypothetical protein n=1 Tax=Sorangium sp. So ce426 TaxID=3133312 RepID=UPI003F5B41AF